MTHLDMTVGSDTSQALPMVREIGIMDLRDALAKGVEDFRAIPTHVIFLSIIYPVGALIVAQLTLNDLIHLFFPLAALLIVIFLLWIAVAHAIYVATFGNSPPESIPTFLRQVFTTPQGWTL